MKYEKDIQTALRMDPNEVYYPQIFEVPRSKANMFLFSSDVSHCHQP